MCPVALSNLAFVAQSHVGETRRQLPIHTKENPTKPNELSSLPINSMK
jgi:hypothetical protein